MIRDLLKLAVGALREGLVITDQLSPGAPIIFANETFCRITGYTEEEVVGRNCRFLQAHDREQPARWVLADALARGVPATAKIRNYTKSGRLFLNDLSISPLKDAGGQVTHYVGVVADVTVEQLAAEQRAVIEQRAQHRQRVEALGTLAGGIAHDVGNTLVPISSLSQLLAAKLPEGSEEQEMVLKIFDASQRIQDLIGEIRLFTRREVVSPVPLKLADEVSQVMALFRSGLTDDLSLTTRIDSRPIIVAERSRLHQVMLNLLTNAQHATANVADPKIDVCVSEVGALEHEPGLSAGGFAHVLVADNGRGMDAETRARAFDPFFTTKAPDEGSGMGLAIVHGIVSNAGGTIRLESAPGEGTKVHIFWPKLGNALD
ncbi:MAG TPA: ATP-binding protein [Devosia sp.]|jgi:PAS domain S-box-containing protein|uniref:two-component system sensor histidine kinase NtrB n=1 Tax=Devosia sp. TaxID=1871048 RepID=UPI002F94B274